LGIPLIIALLILVISNPLELSGGGHNLDYFTIMLVVLSITSAGFFLSFSDLGGTITKIAVLVSGLISIYSIFCIYTVVGGILSPLQTSWNVVILIEAIYWMILMPIIGLCYYCNRTPAGNNSAIQTRPPRPPDNGSAGCGTELSLVITTGSWSAMIPTEAISVSDSPFLGSA